MKSTTKTLLRIGYALLFALASTQFCHAIIVTGYTQDQHDSEHGNSSFILNGVDLSGVGRNGEIWATMISDEYFVSASHFRPAVGASITFVHPPGSMTTSSTRIVQSGSSIANLKRGTTFSGSTINTTTPGIGGDADTDIWIGKLTAPVHADVATYQIGAVSIGDTVYTVGNCPDALPGGELCSSSTTQGIVVGTNSAEDFVNSTTTGSGGSWSHIGIEYALDATPGDTSFEARDSGGPTFVLNGSGMLELVGIHSGVSGTDSVDVALQAYSGEIAAAIPEPGSALTLALATVVVAGFRRFRRQ